MNMVFEQNLQNISWFFSSVLFLARYLLQH